MTTEHCCPQCGAPLRLHWHRGIELDRCPAGCGFWCDAGELALVAPRCDEVALPAAASGPAERAGITGCPRGHGPLQPAAYAGDAQTMIARCAVCGGIWVPAAAQARIAAGVRGNAAQERLGKALLAVDDDLRRQRQSVGELKEHTRPGVALRWLAFRIMLPLGDTVRLHRRPHAVYAIIALNVVAFVLELGAHERIGGAFVRWGLRPAVLLGGGHGWTLLTHQFLHAGLGHLAGNMLFLLVFGKAINAWLGQVRFTLFYCCTGALAALAHAALQAHSLVPCVGASGAIAGVMGAYFVRHPLAQIRVLVGTRIVLVPAAAFLALWLFYQGAYAFASAGGSIAFGVAWYAHLGGFAAGALLALLTSGGQTEEETKMLKMQQ